MQNPILEIDDIIVGQTLCFLVCLTLERKGFSKGKKG